MFHESTTFLNKMMINFDTSPKFWQIPPENVQISSKRLGAHLYTWEYLIIFSQHITFFLELEIAADVPKIAAKFILHLTKFADRCFVLLALKNFIIALTWHVTNAGSIFSIIHYCKIDNICHNFSYQIITSPIYV